MVLSVLWTGMVLISVLFSLAFGNGAALTSAALEGAQSGITVCLSMAGALCLWSGVARVMEVTSISAALSRLLSPLLRRLYPASKSDPVLGSALSANFCANLLGLGNAATPMGIRAAQRLSALGAGTAPGPELCRLVVMNTASIQLIPATVAALRASLGSPHPFDILPAVLLTSLASVSAGLLACRVLERTSL